MVEPAASYSVSHRSTPESMLFSSMTSSNTSKPRSRYLSCVLLELCLLCILLQQWETSLICVLSLTLEGLESQVQLLCGAFRHEKKLVLLCRGCSQVPHIHGSFWVEILPFQSLPQKISLNKNPKRLRIFGLQMSGRRKNDFLIYDLFLVLIMDSYIFPPYNFFL